LIVAYDGLALLRGCLASVFASPDAPPAERVVVVDNASSDGTLDWLKQHYPRIVRLGLPINTGFAGGNNVGFTHIRSAMPQCRYVALLNQDTTVKPGWAEHLVRLAEERPRAGSIQSKLLFPPSSSDVASNDPELFDSAGNESHYLGFGFVSKYRLPSDQEDTVRPIAFCSGAAMLVRVAAIQRDDLFPDEYFAYLEDAELGWRLRLSGYENLYCPDSVVYHHHEFGRNPLHYYRLEANRWRLVLTYYRWPTLLLLLPAMVIMELGLLFYFLRVKSLGEKMRSWGVFASLRKLAARRREAQAVRVLTDRQLTSLFIANVVFPEVRNPLLTYVGNPLLRLYWCFARSLLWW